MTDLHRLEVSAAARRQRHQLPDPVAAAVVEFITVVLPGNPARLSTPLTGGREGLPSARRGDYRVLPWIDEEDQRVVVVRIAHRSDAYRCVPPSPADPRERPD